MNESAGIRVCYWPGREVTFVRNRTLIKGMREVGITVLDCSGRYKNFSRYIESFTKFLKYRSQADVIFIGFLGQMLVPVARLFSRKPIIFDAFLSTFQTLVNDRKSIHPRGIIARLVRTIEKFSCCLSQTVFLDTEQHINYYINTYCLDRRKFKRLLLGADDSLMKPDPNAESMEFLVQFHGEYQALHGTEYIVEAASLLPDVRFRMIGAGRQYQERIRQAELLGVKNIQFIPWVPFHRIPRYIAEASVCLGIFGKTNKSGLVIPLKIFEALAMAKPVVTADTASIRELLTDGDDVSLCRAADAKDLSRAILELRDNLDLRRKIAEGGYQTYLRKCRPAVLGAQIKMTIHEILSKNAD